MKKKIAVSLLILCLIFIYYMSSKNGNSSTMISNNLLVSIKDFFNIKNIDFVSDYSFSIRKLAHFTEFMILGILSTIVFKVYYRKSFIFSFVFSCLYAVLDEIHQLFVPGRACLISDMILDTFGCLFGVLLVFVYLKNEKRNKYRRNAS